MQFLPFEAIAHQVPNEVTVKAFVKPEGQRLRFLARVSLEALQDVNWPTYGPGYLNLKELDVVLNDAAKLWILDNVNFYENDFPLSQAIAVHSKVSLPSDKSFASYQEALSHIQGPRLPDGTELYWEQGMLDVLFDYPIKSDQSDFSIDPSFERFGLHVQVSLRFLSPDGDVYGYQLEGHPGLIRLDPRWHQAAIRFLSMGFLHILDGIDHLLFLLCLVMPFRGRFRSLLLIVTSFTIAHSITFLASVFGLAPDGLWFPPFVELLIAMSIIYMAVENLIEPNVERRWVITFGFGLIHGFGFSFGLQEVLQFAGTHFLMSLVSFNIGVELGQVFVLIIMIPALSLIFRYGVAERIGLVLASIFVSHTAWHWMVERWTVFRQYSLPGFDSWLSPSVLKLVMVVVALIGIAWLFSSVLRFWINHLDRGKDGTNLK